MQWGRSPVLPLLAWRLSLPARPTDNFLIYGPVLIYRPLQLDRVCCDRATVIQCSTLAHTAGTAGSASAAADDVGASSSAKFVTWTSRHTLSVSWKVIQSSAYLRERTCNLLLLLFFLPDLGRLPISQDKAKANRLTVQGYQCSGEKDPSNTGEAADRLDGDNNWMELSSVGRNGASNSKRHSQLQAQLLAPVGLQKP